MDGASHYTLNITLTLWVLYSSTSDLVNSRGTCLGLATKHLIEYHCMIGLLIESLSNDVSDIMVYLDSDLVVHLLN